MIGLGRRQWARCSGYASGPVRCIHPNEEISYLAIKRYRHSHTSARKCRATPSCMFCEWGQVFGGGKFNLLRRRCAMLCFLTMARPARNRWYSLLHRYLYVLITKLSMILTYSTVGCHYNEFPRWKGVESGVNLTPFFKISDNRFFRKCLLTSS